MSYPTMEQVEAMSHYDLARMWRFQGSPGQDAVGQPDFQVKLGEQLKIQKRAMERFEEMGGWNPSLSKQVGW